MCDDLAHFRVRVLPEAGFAGDLQDHRLMRVTIHTVYVLSGADLAIGDLDIVPSRYFGDSLRNWFHTGKQIMQIGRLLPIVGGALAIGLFIGFAAGLDNPPAQDEVQWETLLAGAAAIIGGWLAYNGAIHPFVIARKQSIDLHLHEFEKVCAAFLYVTDANDANGRQFLEDFRSGKLDVENDVIVVISSSTVQDIPEIPKEIKTPKLIDLRQDIVIEMNSFKLKAIRHNRDPLRVREKIISYISELKKSE
ncbi:hypothetical protein [Thalassospira xiamenensis]|uniref:Uncharacterized protein n=1 Tax=Thalassospira xiamenensis TaxID=220697 RepID=A0A285TV40_9PROT|nr:hypothetical protein [Thalassospira xiamenensis]SOC28186.1 hypothetical protein SAMN05428964_106134 [Thalassospira xiamenensis]